MTPPHLRERAIPLREVTCGPWSQESELPADSTFVHALNKSPQDGGLGS